MFKGLVNNANNYNLRLDACQVLFFLFFFNGVSASKKTRKVKVSWSEMEGRGDIDKMMSTLYNYPQTDLLLVSKECQATYRD